VLEGAAPPLPFTKDNPVVGTYVKWREYEHWSGTGYQRELFHPDDEPSWMTPWADGMPCIIELVGSLVEPNPDYDGEWLVDNRHFIDPVTVPLDAMSPATKHEYESMPPAGLLVKDAVTWVFP
jgi:hypothetical protein